ncbi:clostripain-related cysteine peptidase [Neolewinella persica]|uniref:clostripain-related cysteine peptidase n=1 Tax=Neolewinella persica TaxID=70998 RepID=UPI00036BA817|nr:clostripain-related cysteine peptidase [Neolewinella persica]
MRNLFFFLALLGAGLSSTATYAQETKNWTLIVYLVGSDLESGFGAGSTDMTEMMSISNTSNVNIVVLTGASKKDGWRTTKSYLIKDGVRTDLSFVAPSPTAMSSPENLTAFINWSVTNYPATNYFLTMWNHGMSIRGYGHDEVANKQFSVTQVGEAIAATNYVQTGNKFELIGFDACLMANLEAQLPLKDYGKYLVASEETEPGHGWDYAPIVRAMQQTEFDWNGFDIGYEVVDGFIAQGIAENSGPTTTLSVTDLTALDGLRDKLELLIAKIKQEGKHRSLQQARAVAQEYSQSLTDPQQSEDVVDIGDLMKKLKVKDPSLAAEADAVLTELGKVVLYERHSSGRPNSTGLTMFIPHNIMVDTSQAGFFVRETYAPLQFSNPIRDYITTDYFTAVAADQTPPSGQQEDNFGNIWGGQNGSVNKMDNPISAIRVNHASDLEEVRVVLVEEFPGMPDEFIILGSTFPDTSAFVAEDEEIFAYEFDGMWLGINGFPAYISDLYEYEVEDENGNVEFFTRIQIPALLNYVDDDNLGEEIMISYRYDENFNITFENIIPQTYDVDGFMIPGKRRINLVPGDVVQLTYESFNEVTDEEFFVIDDDAVITIENGNEDLMLEYDNLFVGNYRIGYLLTDHSQNDTLIFDDNIFSVISDAVTESFANGNIAMYPNPVNADLTIENNNFTGGNYSLRLIDMNGRQVFSATFNQRQATIPTGNLPTGLYGVELVSGTKIFTDKVLIQH